MNTFFWVFHIFQRIGKLVVGSKDLSHPSGSTLGTDSVIKNRTNYSQCYRRIELKSKYLFGTLWSMVFGFAIPPLQSLSICFKCWLPVFRVGSQLRMLDSCCASTPTQRGGLGCDNMTVVIVRFEDGNNCPKTAGFGSMAGRKALAALALADLVPRKSPKHHSQILSAFRLSAKVEAPKNQNIQHPRHASDV